MVPGGGNAGDQAILFVVDVHLVEIGLFSGVFTISRGGKALSRVGWAEETDVHFH